MAVSQMTLSLVANHTTSDLTHGQRSCPGRFFATNEIKYALCHLLLK